jgi:hypothetical protein
VSSKAAGTTDRITLVIASKLEVDIDSAVENKVTVETRSFR